MAKEEVVKSNEILVFSFGFLSVLLSFLQPIGGVIFGIIGLTLTKKFRGEKDSWVKAGRILSLVGIILSVVVIILSVVFAYYVSSNSEILSQLQNLQGGN